MTFRAAYVVGLVPLLGCATLSNLLAGDSDFKEVAGKSMNCPANRIDSRHRGNVWTFTGCDKQFLCTAERETADSLKCEETEGSPRLARERAREAAEKEFRLELARGVAKHTKCPVEGTKAEGVDPKLSLTGNRSWRVDQCDRVFICLLKERDTGDCEETEESEARLIHRIAKDRLALETGCAVDKISDVGQANYTRGTETAYRMQACGKDYVCTTAAGRTDCKAALAVEGAATATP